MPRKFSDAIEFLQLKRDIAILRLELLDENKKTISSFSPNEEATYDSYVKQHNFRYRIIDCRLIMSVRNPFNTFLGDCFDFLSEFNFDRKMVFVQTKQIFPYYAMIDSETIARTKEIKISFKPRK